MQRWGRKLGRLEGVFFVSPGIFGGGGEEGGRERESNKGLISVILLFFLPPSTFEK